MKRAVMYLRLSRDDGEEIESNSISSQRELIKAYGKQHGLNISCEYVDDGVSGATFNRPSFKRMMGDLEKGKIETIVVKTYLDLVVTISKPESISKRFFQRKRFVLFQSMIIMIQ